MAGDGVGFDTVLYRMNVEDNAAALPIAAILMHGATRMRQMLLRADVRAIAEKGVISSARE